MNAARDVAELFTLKGRVLLVTGARRGLGWEVAQLAASAGAHVVLNDIDVEAVEARVAELQSEGLSASASAFDVTDHAVVRRSIDAIVEALGSIDIVVNNAGIQNRKSFVDYAPEEWEAIMRVHVTGSFNVSQAAVRHMARKKFGRIVMVSSVVATSVRGTLGPYAAAKGAIASLTRELAQEFGPQGITCNAIAPGFLATEFTSAMVENAEFCGWIEKRVPMGRWGLPGDVAPAVIYLASAAGAFVNGAVLTIDGGLLAGL